MYAVIKSGGKQQRVKAGDVIEIELVHRQEHEDEITFTPLLVVDDNGKTHVGKELGRAVVKGTLVGEKKGEKHKIFKYRAKTGYAKRQGHRQMYTLVEIQDISLGRRAASKKADADKVGAEATETETEKVAGAAPAEPVKAEAEAAEGPTPEDVGKPPEEAAAEAAEAAEEANVSEAGVQTSDETAEQENA